MYNPTKTQSPAVGTTLSLGAQIVTLTATDAAGNTGACSFSVTVVDQTAPSISCPANATATSGGALKLTTARWYTPSGRSIDRRKGEDGDTTKDDDRPHFSSDAGRTILGGGGIIPDVVAGDTVQSPQELALAGALGKRIPEFRDALTAHALSVKQSPPASPDFAVTPEMRDALWQVMQARGLTFDRKIYDAAAPIVSLLIAREVSRYAFGPAAEARRSINDDEVIQEARRLLTGVRTPEDVLSRTAPRAAAR